MTTELDDMPDYVETEETDENGEDHEIQELNGKEELEYTEELISSMDKEEEEEEEGENEEEEGDEEEVDNEPEPTPPVKVSKTPQKKSTLPPPPAKKATVPPQKKTTLTPVKNAAPPPKPVPLKPNASAKPTPVQAQAPTKEQSKTKTMPEKVSLPRRSAPQEISSKTNGSTTKRKLTPDVPPSIAKNPSPDVANKKTLSANEEEQLKVEESPKKRPKPSSSSKSPKTGTESSAEKKDGFGGPSGKKMWFQGKFAAATNNIYERHKERGEDYLKEIDPLEGKSFKEKSEWLVRNLLYFMHYENITELKKIAQNKDPLHDLHSPKDFTPEHQKTINDYATCRYLLANILQCEHHDEEDE